MQKMFPKSKYADIFGKPGEGFHSYRVFNIAVFDVLGTFLLAYIISKIWKQSFNNSLLIMLISGIILHIILGVDTTVTLYIGSLLEGMM